jgi:hypothetical protein
MNWCNGQVGKALDFDGQYGAQCTDFFNFYYQLITGHNPYHDGYAVPGAKDIWNVPTALFTKVPNNASDPNQLPPQGAILIYDGGLSGSGGEGHVAVIDSANAKQVTVFDQNWGGMYVHHQSHMWTGHELGWLVFNGFEQNITLPQLTDVYQQLLNRAPDQSGIDHYVGHYTYAFVVNDIKQSAEYAQDHAPHPTPVTPAPVPAPAPTPAPVVPSQTPAPTDPASPPTPQADTPPTPPPAPTPIPTPVVTVSPPAPVTHIPVGGVSGNGTTRPQMSWLQLLLALIRRLFHA